MKTRLQWNGSLIATGEHSTISPSPMWPVFSITADADMKPPSKQNHSSSAGSFARAEHLHVLAWAMGADANEVALVQLYLPPFNSVAMTAAISMHVKAIAIYSGGRAARPNRRGSVMAEERGSMPIYRACLYSPCHRRNGAEEEGHVGDGGGLREVKKKIWQNLAS